MLEEDKIQKIIWNISSTFFLNTEEKSMLIENIENGLFWDQVLLEIEQLFEKKEDFIKQYFFSLMQKVSNNEALTTSISQSLKQLSLDDIHKQEQSEVKTDIETLQILLNQL